MPLAAPSLPLQRVLGSQSPWLRPFNDRTAIDDLLTMFDPLWSLDRIRARVETVLHETANARTLILRPNRHWHGFRAGQHVVVELEIDGVRHHRTYSLSSSPQDPLLAITVKRQHHGRVSNWLNDYAQPGLVLGLSEACGDFVLPTPLPPRLLLIGAGSGMTPLMAMLRDLQQRRSQAEAVPEITLLQICRDSHDELFGPALRKLSADWPALRHLTHHSREHGRPDAAVLRHLLPELGTAETYLCGPEDFMTMVEQLWRQDGIASRLHTEHFGIRPTTSAPTGPHRVQCRRSQRDLVIGDQSLLLETEAAGLKPKHGCRIGICRSCQCRKLSGTTENLLTGEVDAEPDQPIQLCITRARSDLQLDL